jgi:hypothetical protein
MRRSCRARSPSGRRNPKDLAIYALCEEPLARLAYGRPRVITRVVGERNGNRETFAEFETVRG